MFKIGVITDGFRLPFIQAIEAAAKLGAEGIQFYATEGETSPAQMTAERIKDVKDRISSNGIVVSALCADFGGGGFCRVEENCEKIERTKRVIDLALQMGSNVVTTHIGVIPEEKKAEQWKILHEACERISEYAQSVGAFFSVETGPEKAVVLKEFLDSISTKGMAVNLDPANLVMVAGDDPVKAVYTLKDYIVHTHAKDGIMLTKTEAEKIYGNFSLENRQSFYLETPLGEGGVDYDNYLKALADIGYQGFLTIEREVGEDPAADIALAVGFLREKMKKA